MTWIRFGETHYNLDHVSQIEFVKRTNETQAQSKDSITVDADGARFVHTFGDNITKEQWENFLLLRKVMATKLFYSPSRLQEM